MLCYCLKPNRRVKSVRMPSISVMPFHQNFLEGNQACFVILGYIHSDEKNLIEYFIE